ncbi:MAG TPA: phosphoribosylanthranilate isomerase [Gemmatimonadaceae bacterium]|nr:phosphoribosylanthranilate isomerase [Gemmatimonadaceae bacterium]
MAVEVKFCGLTQAADTEFAITLGASYVGVIFAESPRRVAPSAVSDIVDPARGRAKVVGVFGPSDVETIATTAADAALDVVQLHGDPSPGLVERVRPFFAGEVWAVLRIAGAELPANATALMNVADAVVLDARVSGHLGGTGTAFDWEGVAKTLDRQRVRSRIVLAGGLNQDNVAHAVRVVAPDIVDVSSGVESAPGIKDHSRMRAFSDAVRRRGDSP